MLSIFNDMIKNSIKVFMYNFFIFGETFDSYLKNVDIILKYCIETNLTLN